MTGTSLTFGEDGERRSGGMDKVNIGCREWGQRRGKETAKKNEDIQYGVGENEEEEGVVVVCRGEGQTMGEAKQ